MAVGEGEKSRHGNYNYIKETRRVCDLDLLVCYKIDNSFNQQFTNNLLTDCQQSADILSTVGHLSVDRSLPLWKKLSADSLPTVGQLSVNCQSTVSQ